MKRKALGLLATGLLAAFAANATPVTFKFDMPTWTFASLPGVFGTNAALYVTLDNGSSSFLGQAYLNTRRCMATLPSGFGPAALGAM